MFLEIRNNKLALRVFYKFYSLQKKLLQLSTLKKNEIFRSSFILDSDIKKDYCFVFGSGASINRLSNANFEFISKFYSIGINQWILHSFVPNLFFFESGKGSVEDKITFLKLRKVLQKRENDFQNSSFLLPTDSLWVLDELRRLNIKFHFYSVLPFLFRDISKLDFVLNYLRNNLFKDNINHMLFGSGSSVLRAVLLAEYFGFKKIVLLGIDLGGDYFYEQEHKIQELWGISNFQSNQPQGSHITESYHKPFKLSFFLEALQESKEFKAELIVPFSDSKLSSFCNNMGW